METIYDRAIDAVKNGARFRVDLPNRSLSINKQYIIKSGQYIGELGIPNVDNLEEYLNSLYSIHYHSIPTERSEQKRFRYFRALPEDKLSDEDMLYGESRDVAQITLELFILGAVLLDFLQWESFAAEKWYWQSKSHPSFIILKQWINP